MNTIECVGASGKKYLYYKADPSQSWKKSAGNYLFCKPMQGGWKVQYVGQCEDFNDRMPRHDRFDEAKKDYGVTAIFAHTTVGGDDIRKTEEQDLIEAYNPPMNVQHRTASPSRKLVR